MERQGRRHGFTSTPKADAADQLAASWESLHRGLKDLTEWFQRRDHLVAARGRADNDDWLGARRTLRPLLDNNPRPHELALDALAATQLSAPDVSAATQRAEDSLVEDTADDDRSAVRDAHKTLAAVYLKQGQMDAAAAHWRAYLDAAGPEEWVDARVNAMANFGWDTDLGPIAAISQEYAARTSPDEAAYRAVRAAHAGDRQEATAHLARANQMIREGVTPQLPTTYRELARTYAELGDADGTAASWASYLASLDHVERRVATDSAATYLEEMANDPKVEAVTEEFRERE